jgi:predicted permease
VPGITSVSLVPDPPVSGYTMWAPSVYVEGGAQEDAELVGTHMVGPDYFETMGISLVGGRSITISDDGTQPPVAVASEAAAARLWPGEDPIGKRMRLSATGSWVTVVGVVGDVRQGDLATPSDGALYVPYAQNAWFPWAQLVMRSSAEPELIARAMRQVLREVDPDLPVGTVVRMSDRVTASLHRQRFNAVMLVIVSVVGLGLTAAGIYGMLLYAVAQRAHEVGIRLALGARSSQVLRSVVRRGMTVAAAGIVLGIVGALILSRVLSSLVYGITTTDPPTLVGVAVLLAAVAFVACYAPARRASRTDPMRALRAE